jgi:hypothetical protein
MQQVNASSHVGSESTNDDVAADEGLAMVEVDLSWKIGTIIIKPHVEVLVLVSFKPEWLCSMLVVSSFEVFACAYT